jgi:signal transduction histidine kinase
MRSRIRVPRWRASIRLRAALLATLVTAVAFGTGALWQRHSLYQRQMDASTQQAFVVAAAVGELFLADGWPGYPLHFDDRVGLYINAKVETSSWVMMAEDGTVLTYAGYLGRYIGTHEELAPAVMGVPDRNRTTLDLSHDDLGTPLDGRTVTLAVEQRVVSAAVYRQLWVLRGVRPLTGYDPAAPPGRLPSSAPDDPEIIRIYALASPFEAEAAVAAVDRTLVLALPVAALLVGCLTWVVAGRVLRPVDAIRAQLADITARDLGRRVPVPATGDEIGRLAVTTNATLDRLQAAVEQQRQFVADAAHELRSPLAGLRNELEVAVAHPDPASWPAAAAAALRAAKRLQSLTEDLLTLARADRPAAPAGPLVDLTALVAEQLAERAYLNPDGPRFVAAGPGPLSAAPTEPAGPAQPTRPEEPGRAATLVGAAESSGRLEVPGDESQLGRLLRNLLDNAGRHAASTVTVSLRPNRTSVLLEVADDGPGVAAADRERVFGRFTRLDDDRGRDHGGAGLGLAIVAGIAARHGGDARVADSDRGARFVVRLPLAVPAAPDEGRARPVRPAAPAGAPVETRPAPAARAAHGSALLRRRAEQVDQGSVGGQPVDVVELVRGQPAQRPVFPWARLTGGDPATPDPQEATARNG